MASAAQTFLNLSQARTRLGSRELIEKIRAGSQVAVLVEELKVHPMYSLIKCKYGNFVLASLIQQAAPRDCADEVYAKIADNVRYVATHQFGSRIIEHLLENTSIVQLESLTAKLLTDTVALAHDRFGNYVLQHIWEAQPVCRQVIVQACRTRFASMALHRFARHVIWCVVENDCDTASLEYIAEELLDDPHVFEQCCIGYVSSGVAEKLARLAGLEGGATDSWRGIGPSGQGLLRSHATCICSLRARLRHQGVGSPLVQIEELRGAAHRQLQQDERRPRRLLLVTQWWRDRLVGLPEGTSRGHGPMVVWQDHCHPWHLELAASSRPGTSQASSGDANDHRVRTVELSRADGPLREEHYLRIRPVTPEQLRRQLRGTSRPGSLRQVVEVQTLRILGQVGGRSAIG